MPTSSTGPVYFSVASDPEFGKLSHIPLAEQLELANERGNDPDDPNKRDPLDFVLWQAQGPGEPAWEARGGRAGRAGISNARPWRRATSARSLISTAAGAT